MRCDLVVYFVFARLTLTVVLGDAFVRAQQAQHRYPQGGRVLLLGKVQGEAAQVCRDH